MEKIKIFSLGGLNETGKNTYIIEINDEIYVFDCGLKYYQNNQFGIDYIIPDYEYLVKNKNRIKGVFITHGHFENMGAALDLVNNIPDIKFYATHYTKFVLMDLGVKEDNIIEIVPNKRLVFGSISIFPLSVSHSVPGAVMYCVNTSKGAICYTGDFIFDPLMKGAYDMDLGRIAYVGKQGVLCLLAESSFSEHHGHTSPTHRLESFFADIINKNDTRIMFSVLPTHLYTIGDIFRAARNTHRKIVIMGKRLQNYIHFAKEEGYLDIVDGQIGDLSNINDSNAILLICDDKANAYAAINKIVGGFDKYITLKENDVIVFAEPRYDSSEKVIVKLENDIAMAGAHVISIPKDKNILHHASREDLMMMLKLLNPKYYIPVKGEYRYMVNNANVAFALGIPKENIFLKENGDVIEIDDGEYVETNEHIKVNDALIDGKSSDDIGELVIKDREMLSDNGIVLISATISKKNKIILVGPEITTRGFIYVRDSKELINQMKSVSEEIINRNIVDGFVDYNKIKTDIRSELSSYLYEQTSCKPMIIAVIQEI